MAGRRQGNSPDQGALIADPTDRPLRVERAVASAIRAGQHDGKVDTRLDAGTAALARELGRAVDRAGMKRDPYGVAAASRELREVLGRLGLDPRARDLGPGGGLAEVLADLAKPTPPTEDQPAG